MIQTILFVFSWTSGVFLCTPAGLWTPLKESMWYMFEQKPVSASPIMSRIFLLMIAFFLVQYIQWMHTNLSQLLCMLSARGIDDNNSIKTLWMKIVTHLISWYVWLHVFRVNKSSFRRYVRGRLRHIRYTLCVSQQHLQLVTCTCEEVSGWAPWLRSMGGVRGTACAPPTLAWAPGMWRGRSSRLWKASRWWRKIQMGERVRETLW